MDAGDALSSLFDTPRALRRLSWNLIHCLQPTLQKKMFQFEGLKLDYPGIWTLFVRFQRSNYWCSGLIRHNDFPNTASERAKYGWPPKKIGSWPDIILINAEGGYRISKIKVLPLHRWRQCLRNTSACLKLGRCWIDHALRASRLIPGGFRNGIWESKANELVVEDFGPFGQREFCDGCSSFKWTTAQLSRSWSN